MDELVTIDFKNKSSNVLYISYDGMTDPLGQSQVLPYLIGLTKKGLHFHLISFEKKERFNQFSQHIQSICNQNNITWHPLKYSEGNPLVSTVYDVQKMKKKAFELHKKHDFSIVHCRSYISALVGLSLKKKGVKFIFDMRGFFADERVDGGLWNLSSPIYRTVYNYFKKKEIQYFSKSDYTVSLTNNGKQEILSWDVFKKKPIEIQVIPCCVDLNLFDPNNINESEKLTLKRELGITENDFIIGYIGSIGTWYMLPEMLDAFKKIKLIKPNSKFLFVTGEKSEVIEKELIKKDIKREDVIVKSSLHKDVPLHISLFDTSIFFIKPTYSKKASSPTKQGEIMAMGIPLICNKGVGDTDFVVEKYAAGKVIDLDSNWEIKSEDLINFDKKKSQYGANDFYSLASGIEKYALVYKKVYE